MESSDEETDSGALGPAYSLTDMLDELGSDSTSGVTSPVPSEGPLSPSHQPKEKSIINTDATTTAANTTNSDSITTTAPPVLPGETTCTTAQGQGQSEVKVADGGATTKVVDQSKTDVQEAQALDSVSVKDTKSGTTNSGKSSKEESVEETRSSEKSQTLLNTVGKEESQEATLKTKCAISESLGSEKTEEVDNMKDKQTNKSPINGNISEDKRKSLLRQNDLNGNTKTGSKDRDSKLDEDIQSDELSDEAVHSKDDPVWKRKKVIKRKKPKKSLTSQSSTGSDDFEGSTSSIGSVNGLVKNPIDTKALTPDREIWPANCDKIKTNEIYPVHESQDNITNENIENEKKNDPGKDVTIHADNKPGNAQEEGTGTGNAQNESGSAQTVTGSEQTGNAEVDEFSGYEPYEFRSPSKAQRGAKEEDIYCNVPDSAIYENIASRSDPRRSTLRRGATLRGLSVEDLAGMTYQGSLKLIKVLPDEHPSKSTESLTDGAMRGVDGGGALSQPQDDIYESVSLPRAPLSPTTPPVGDDEYDDFSWGSSEFESYDEDDDLPQDGGQEPISVTVEVKSRSSQEPTNQNVLNKLAAKIGPRSWSRDDSEDSSTYLEVTLNMEKHPPPELPPAPPDLTPQQGQSAVEAEKKQIQIKRRHIVASIVESERSYTNSLRRIIEEYEKPLLFSKPQIISKNSIKVIFYRLRDILQCHNMFHIELAEYIRVWDTQEKLGNVFTASFSKSMVFDVYSEFVNNFTLAMETAKKLAKQKQAFADFLKLKIQNSPDKLSLFGLMVKPVQRFPQFILCLQDLLKHTSRDHHDRLALQLALTELETLTHKLNEMKRESENKHEVKKIQSSMTGSRFSLKHDNRRCLVRQDDMIQLDSHGGSRKTKARRLFLMNDQLVCTTVVQKDGDTGLAEKFKFKWSIPIRDVEVVESEVPDLYQVQGGPGRSLIVAPKLDRSTFSPWKKELDDMMHDLAIVEQITNLTSQLRLNYPGLSTDLLFNVQRSLQLSIQDQGDLDLCILHLSLPTKLLQTSTDKIKEEMSKHIPHKTKSTRANRMLHTFQVQSASIKQDWLLDLKNAKLSLDPSNKPGWYVPETDQGHCLRMPLFVKPLLIDITKEDTKIQCAIPVVLPSYTNPYIGVQHLWVCSNESSRGQVTIVSLHSSQPHVLESFIACDSRIQCAEHVPGFIGGYEHEHAFAFDTVWMAMESNELCVRSVVEEERSAEPLLVMDTDGEVTCLRFMDSRLYAGLADGRLAIYNRDRDGIWQIEERLLVELGESSVNSLLPLNHQMWAACENKVHLVRVTARWRAGSLHHDVKTSSHEVGSSEEEVLLCMVKAGVGLMVSFRGRGVIRIYNQETFNHLQDVNVASAVAQILEGKDLGDLRIEPRRVAITFMLASKGLLWIGTDSGCTLTLPLPRLEGVPQIKGRPSVSYHAHLGPIKFIVPIHCGVTQLHAPPTSPLSTNQSQANQSEHDLDAQSDNASDAGGQVDAGGAAPSAIVVEGATESETNCDDSYESEEQPVDAREDSEDVNKSLLNELSLQKSRSDYLSTSMLHLPQQGTMGRAKWTSTPDLRHGSAVHFNDSEEDVILLYNNLLRGAEYEHYDEELMGAKGKRRPQSDMGYPALYAARMNRRGSKYATLPILMEDSQTFQAETALPEGQNEDSLEPSFERSFSTESGGDRSPGLPILNDTPSEFAIDTPRSPSRPGSMHNSHASLGPTPSAMTHSQKSLSKSVVIVTGGEGHINWAEKNAGDTKYDDICLLLWQCRV